MAEAALVSLSKTIDLYLNYHQDAISPEVKDQIISINEYVILLHWFLEHFPDKASSLEAIIRDVTHVAEDIIEFLTLDHIYEPRYTVHETSVRQPNELYRKGFSLHPELEDIFQLWKSFSSLVESFVGPSEFIDQPKLCYKPLRYEFHDLREATEEIQSIAEMVMKMKRRILERDERNNDSTAVNTSSSRVAPSHKEAMVGFENDSLEIKSRLCGESFKLKVIPIVGMGGIGKTTLARNVYDDPLITEHFQIRVWVTISQDFRVKEIVSRLLISMKLFQGKSESMRADDVYKSLKSRRYLIVLDDVWSTEAWDDLKWMFPDDCNGSRIMLTTRLFDVATYPDSYSPVHEMRLMDEDQSWNLLRKTMFKEEECPVELKYAGKVIARSCKGLPLAIVVLSGILSSIDRSATAWESISENVATLVSVDKILSLSYTHLPRHLRSCLLYMGSFREDYEVRASKLIKLWAAEGFLKPNGCNKSFEETANEYLEDLVKRSLFMVTKRKPDGRIKSLSIHDLMREMCIRIAKEEKFLRHVCVPLRQDINILDTVSSGPSNLDFPGNFYGLNVRTILLSGHVQQSALFCLRHFRLLRILDLLDAFATLLPPQVLKLFHLRFLAFHGSLSNWEGISNLQNLHNLHSLIIYPRPFSKYVSEFQVDISAFLLEIWSMPQLMHLVIRSGFCFCLPPPSHQQGAKFCLENLQTLSLAINFICTPEILETIPNLKKLAIWYSMYRDDEDDYHLHNLVYLQHLENLKLKIDWRFPSREKVKPAFPSTLRKLTLSCVRLPWEDMGIVGSLPNLQVLKLRDYACAGDTWETNEGEFSQLKFLLIDEAELQEWKTGSSHFPKLVCLVLHRCTDLTEIPDDIGDVATLEIIEVDDEDLYESAKKIQDDQNDYGNEVLQIRLVKCKDSTYPLNNME